MAAPTLLEIDATQQTLEITSSRDAVSIQGRSIETGTPTDGEVLTYSTSASEWVYLSVDENVDDRVAALIQDSAGGGLTWTYDDSAGTLTPAYVGDSTLVTSGALNSGSITSGFGTINSGSSAITAGAASFTTISGSTSLALATGATVTGIDNGSLGSSATLLATQGAVKTYVDAQVTAQDLDIISDSGNIDIDLDSESLTLTGGTGLASSATGTTVTFAIDSTVATLSGSQTLTNKTIAGGSNTLSAIANGSLTNSTVAYGGVSLSLGGADTTPAFNLSDATAYPGDSSLVTAGVISSGTWSADTIAVNKGGTGATSLTADRILLGDGTSAIKIASALSDGEVLIGNGAGAPTVLDLGSSSGITIVSALASGSIASGFTSISTSYTDAKVTSVVAGDLVDVSGATGDVTVNVDLSELSTSTSDGDGDFFAVVDSANAQKKITKANIYLSGFYTAVNTFITGTGALDAGSITSGFGAIDVGSSSIDGGTITGTFSGNITGNVTGNCSGTAGSATGNAATATALASARNIGGVSFDGTGNIDLPGVNTAGNQDTSGTAADATVLETARTIGGTSFNGSANIAVGLSSTATALATARAINGVDFDGTAAVTLTAAAGTLSGATLASGVTASSLTSTGTLGSLNVTGDLTVDSGTLFVDASADTVCVGTTTAISNQKLFVVGNEGEGTLAPPNQAVATFARNVTAGNSCYVVIAGGSTSEVGLLFGDKDGLEVAGIKYHNSTSSMILRVNNANPFSIDSSGDATFTGAVSKGSGSFRIDHPLPSLNDTHSLVHSFIEGPRADLIYRGVATLSSGWVQIDLDEAVGMTDGTWELLCRDPQTWVQNDSGWDAVRGSVEGGMLTIECQDTGSSDTVSWMVVAERQDQHMMDANWTDNEGRVILEPEKPEPVDDEHGVTGD